MHEGKSIKIVQGPGAPRKSPTRGPVAALLVCSIPFSSSAPLLDVIEELPDGEVKRKHIWTFDGQATVRFRPSFEDETIDGNEIVRRFQDDEWCRSHPEHPITYMRGMFDKLCDIQETLKSGVIKPFYKVTKHRTDTSQSYALIPSDATPEEKAALLDGLQRS